MTLVLKHSLSEPIEMHPMKTASTSVDGQLFSRRQGKVVAGVRDISALPAPVLAALFAKLEVSEVRSVGRKSTAQFAGMGIQAVQQLWDADAETNRCSLILAAEGGDKACQMRRGISALVAQMVGQESMSSGLLC